MPKSTHRRNGKTRRRRNQQPTGPTFVHSGRRYRGVAHLPPGYDIPALEARYGDDPGTIVLALLRAALGDDAVEQIIAGGSVDPTGGDIDPTGGSDNPRGDNTITLDPNDDPTTAAPTADGVLDVEAISPLVDQILAYYFADQLTSWITRHLPGGRGAGA